MLLSNPKETIPIQINSMAIGLDVKDGDRTKDTIDRVKVMI